MNLRKPAISAPRVITFFKFAGSYNVELRAEDMTQRQIAAALGVDQKTVSNDLRREENSSSNPETYSSKLDFPELSNPTHVSYLPPSWGTLAVLAQLPPGEILRLIAEGRITPELERREAVQSINSWRAAMS
jgi:transcriptional regulator with XRE-family HTH domain